jgi:hypothetical protein
MAKAGGIEKVNATCGGFRDRLRDIHPERRSFARLVCPCPLRPGGYRAAASTPKQYAVGCWSFDWIANAYSPGASGAVGVIFSEA